MVAISLMNSAGYPFRSPYIHADMQQLGAAMRRLKCEARQPSHVRYLHGGRGNVRVNLAAFFEGLEEHQDES